MNVIIQTKFDIGDMIYVIEPEILTGTGYDAYIFKVTVKSVEILTRYGRYCYLTCKGRHNEQKVFKKLQEAKKYAINVYGNKIKYCGYAG